MRFSQRIVRKLRGHPLPGGVMLIDCGIGPRTVATRMKCTGVSLANVAAICVTHLDRDHFSSIWTHAIIRQNIRLFCPVDRLDELLGYCDNRLLTPLVTGFTGEFEPLPGLIARSMPVAHDNTGCHAFVFTAQNSSIGYATDLGCVPPALLDHFCGVDVLAIESNYDPLMQQTSGRPWFLQKRITGGSGHLSNEQALSAVKTLLDRCRKHGRRLPNHVVLLHRSRQCNCPNLVRRLFLQDDRLSGRLVLAEQDSRTEWLSTTNERAMFGEQLSLDFSLSR